MRSRRTFEQWIADKRWAANATRARRYRQELLFSQKLVFDQELRPLTGDGARIAYPDALYYITINDVVRAYAKAKGIKP